MVLTLPHCLAVSRVEGLVMGPMCAEVESRFGGLVNCRVVGGDAHHFHLIVDSVDPALCFDVWIEVTETCVLVNIYPHCLIPLLEQDQVHRLIKRVATPRLNRQPHLTAA